MRAPAHGAPVPVCRAERAAEAARAPSTGWQADHTVYPYEYPWWVWYIHLWVLMDINFNKFQWMDMMDMTGLFTEKEPGGFGKNWAWKGRWINSIFLPPWKDTNWSKSCVFHSMAVFTTCSANKPRPLPTFPLAFQILSNCSMVRDLLPPTLPYLCRWKVSVSTLNLTILPLTVLIGGNQEWKQTATKRWMPRT